MFSIYFKWYNFYFSETCMCRCNIHCMQSWWCLIRRIKYQFNQETSQHRNTSLLESWRFTCGSFLINSTTVNKVLLTTLGGRYSLQCHYSQGPEDIGKLPASLRTHSQYEAEWEWTDVAIQIFIAVLMGPAPIKALLHPKLSVTYLVHHQSWKMLVWKS